ncbi:MAG: hypothetical protein RL187_452 [Actinomycetota bacterium]
MSGPRVVVIGDVIDDILVTVESTPRHDTDTPARIVRSSGGSAANTASWLAHLGLQVDFVGRVGESDLERFTAEFISQGVTPHLTSHLSAPTGTIVIIVEGESRSMLSDRGANVGLDVSSFDQSLLASASWLHLTGYSFFHHPTPTSLHELILRAADQGTTVMVDASSSGFLEDFGPSLFLELTTGAHVLRCSEDEALVLGGTDDLASCAAVLGAKYPLVVVTRGDAPVVVVEQGRLYEVGVPLPQRSVDPTGAGDAFNAGLLAALVEGSEGAEAVERGIAVAAQCVMVPGARP